MKEKRIARTCTLILLICALLLCACAAPAAKQDADGAAPLPEESSAAAAPEQSQPDAAEEPAPETTAAPGDRDVVYAATTEELLKALRPDTEVHLTGRSYNLSHALGYGNFGGDYYDWNNIYDGYELTVYNLVNFSIVADKPGIEIVTAPRYAAVMRFESCRNLRFEGFTAGHTDGAGTCTGAVLNFVNCSDVAVERCDLYGCGTYGAELDRCRNLTIRDSVIRDCSYGAASAIHSSGVQIDGCTVYGIENYNGIFWFSGCSGAVTNCLVRNCSGNALLWSDSSEIFLGGCEIRDNAFGGMFYANPQPITVESCTFRNNSGAWYFEEWSESRRVVDAEGETLDDNALYNMTQDGDVSWTPPAEKVPDTAPVEPSADGMIHVTNVDELLASIAPGVTIYLEDGIYNLADAAGYGSYTGDGYYYWMYCYDGPGLVLRDLDNFTLTAGGPHRATVTAEPRYADVISFENCSKLNLSNFTAGHTQDPGECAGGVLNFMNCNGVSIQDCSLYGCGVLGVSAYSSRDLSVRYTEIHHCTYGAFSFSDCVGVSAEHCNIHDIPGYIWSAYGCRNMTYDGEPLEDGTIY